jgi:ethylmalonyl-CoA mutase
MQQIMAYETDLLDYGDIFDGSAVIAEKVAALKADIGAEIVRIEKIGGAIAAIEAGYMKAELVKSNARRLKAIEDGVQTVVGVNAFTESEASPLSASEDGAILTVSDHVEFDAVESLKAWRRARDAGAVKASLAALEAAASDGGNIMEPSIAAARAGVTTGEWGAALRSVFGEYRAPTGLGTIVALTAEGEDEARAAVAALARRLGVAPKFLVGKPGLDGHSNGAEQIAVRAGEVGYEVIYDGIRLTPEEIVAAAIEQGVHVVGLSILSGSHVPLVRDVVNRLRAAGLDQVPVVVGGIIPEEDRHVLKQLGVARVYTPKDFRLDPMMADIAQLIAARHGEAAA